MAAMYCTRVFITTYHTTPCQSQTRCKISYPILLISYIYNPDKCLPAIYKQQAKINIIYMFTQTKIGIRKSRHVSQN